MILMWLISIIIDKIKEARRPVKVAVRKYESGYHIPKKLMERGYTGKYNDVW